MSNQVLPRLQTTSTSPSRRCSDWGKKRVSVTEPHRVPSHVPTSRDASLSLLLPQHHHHITNIITATSSSSSICNTRNNRACLRELTVTPCTLLLQSKKPSAVNPKEEEKEVKQREVCSSAPPRTQGGSGGVSLRGARTLPRASSPLRPSGRSVCPGLQFCVAASRISFYIRFSSFMILHKLIQLDNQREKLTQVS